jgi:regulator of protease activity HflC (stomatin/prohibitin superfamily)
MDCLAELDTIIDEVSGIAKEAIERAAAEAARAAVLEMLEREAVALREAQRWRTTSETEKKNAKKLAGWVCVIGLVGGFALGIGAVSLVSR